MWCQNNCPNPGSCPSSHCLCSGITYISGKMFEDTKEVIKSRKSKIPKRLSKVVNRRGITLQWPKEKSIYKTLHGKLD